MSVSESLGHRDFLTAPSFLELGSQHPCDDINGLALPSSLPRLLSRKPYTRRVPKLSSPRTAYWRNMSEEKRIIEREKSRLRMQASRARRKEREFELKEIWKKYIHSESENQEW